MSRIRSLLRPSAVLTTCGLATALVLALPEVVAAAPAARTDGPATTSASLVATALQPTLPTASGESPSPPDDLTEVPGGDRARLALGPPVSAEQARLLARPTAMWLWTWTNSAAVVAYALANNVNHIFAYTAPGFTKPGFIPPGWTVPMLPVVTDLSKRAKAAGIRVDAMGGDPSWVFNPPIARTWAAESLGTGLFTGLHVEIEPWVLSQWPSQLGPLSNALLLTLNQVRAGASGRPIEVSMPFWAWQFVTPDGTRLDTAIMARCDSVAIITYRDTVQGIRDVAITPSQRARAANKPFRWAAETNNVQPPDVTFFGATNTQMLAVLNEAERIALPVTQYRGFAIHDWTGWAAMRR